MTTDPRVLVVGEALVDVVHRVSGEIDEHPGGSPMNVAIGLARLGHPVAFATRFGVDRYGELVRAHIEREPLIRLTAGSPRAARTSVAEAFLDANSAARYEFDLTWDVGEAIGDEPVGHLHIGSIGATMAPGAEDVREAVLRTRETGTVSYDPNVRPTIMGPADGVRGQIEELIGATDVLKASDEDLAWLYPDLDVDGVLSRWGELGPALVVATQGAAGAVVYLPGSGERAHFDCPPADVVDTVGAGDSFMSGLLSGLLDARLLGDLEARERLHQVTLAEVEPAVHRALTCGSVTVSRAGANPPTRQDLPV